MTLGVILYIIYYYIIIYYILLLLYIYYYILYIIYYTILFSSFFLSFPPPSSIPFFSPSSSYSLSFLSLSQPFYTCRYLHILIYTPSISLQYSSSFPILLFSSSIPNPHLKLTPHVLSEWMVEVCR